MILLKNRILIDIEDRQYGGFGIYMVKNAMDDVSYEWKDGKNILTLRKKKREDVL